MRVPAVGFWGGQGYVPRSGCWCLKMHLEQLGLPLSTSI